MLTDPMLMGIINATPDSFYERSRYKNVESAVRHAMIMASYGALWIDVGGASTRPGSVAPSEQEEMDRVMPLVEAIAEEAGLFAISIDTSRASVAREALAAGARGINDVTALSDPQMAGLAAESGCTLFLTHMKGEPANMQQGPQYEDVVAEVEQYLLQRATLAMEAGVARDRIFLDPGIGFGKNDHHNAALIRALPRLSKLGFPIMLGPSRKSFIGRVLGQPNPVDRLEGSLALAGLATWLGVDLLRVHDVLATKKVVNMVAAVRDFSPDDASLGDEVEGKSPC